MSKNNYQEIIRKMTQHQQRFGLRKLSVGVASVLLGTTFLLGAGLTAHADEIGTQQTTAVTATTASANGSSRENVITPNQQVDNHEENQSSADAATTINTVSSHDDNNSSASTTSLTSNEPSTTSAAVNVHDQVVLVSHDDPKQTTDVIEGTTVNYPAGLSQDDLNRTFRRTIHYVYLDSSQNHDDVTKVQAYRDAQYNLATGKIQYGEWHFVDNPYGWWPDFRLPSGDAYLSPETAHTINPGLYDSSKPVFQNLAGFPIAGRPITDDLDLTIYCSHITYHVKYIDALTGQPLDVYQSNPGENLTTNGEQDVQFGNNVSDETIGQYQSDSLYTPFIAAIPGYKFVEGELPDINFKGDYDTLKDQKIGAADRTLILKYAPLSPIKVAIVDKDTNQIIITVKVPTNTALPQSVGNVEKAGPYNYETHPLDNIPGYEYTGEHSDNVTGFVGQTQTKDDENPIVVKYYYKVVPGQEKIAEYTRKGLRDNVNDSHLRATVPGQVNKPINYRNLEAQAKSYGEQKGEAYVGAVNNKGGYFSDTRTVIEFVFTPHQKVTVNYINKLTGEKMKAADGQDSTEVLIPTAADGQNGWKWASQQKTFDGYVLDSVDRQTDGTYGFVQQEVNYYYLPKANLHTETMTVTRTINYRGTHDGNHYQAVNGSPDGKSSYQQTVTFTRNVVKDRYGKTLVTGEWKNVDSNIMPEVPSKKPSDVNYHYVDIPSVPAKTINPNDYQYKDDGQPIRLQPVTVTYRDNNVETNTVVRHIYYRDATNGKKINDELAELGYSYRVPDTTQTVKYVRYGIYNSQGKLLGYAKLQTTQDGLAKMTDDGKPSPVLDDNGHPVLLDDPSNPFGWFPFGEFLQYPEKESPDLSEYGFKPVQSLTTKDGGKDFKDGSKVQEHPSEPEKNGKDVTVYYFHDYSTTDIPDPSETLSKTFTRKIVYRGTKDGGNTYQSVNGSPDETSSVEQSVTFTRKVLIDKVTGDRSYTAWTSSDGTMDAVTSKDSSEVGYATVDKPMVEAYTVNPYVDDSDLGTIVVTYSTSTNPQPDHPSKPDQPGRPDKPVNPGQPGQPTNPDQPGQTSHSESTHSLVNSEKTNHFTSAKTEDNGKQVLNSNNVHTTNAQPKQARLP